MPGMLHPVIRIVTFLVFSAYLAVAEAHSVLLAAVLLGLLYVIHGVACLNAAWPMIRRMRWFFLSILILYFWFTPGQPALTFLPLPTAWLPTSEGVSEGILRSAALLSIILAVNLLLYSTSQAQLVAAIHWLVRPLRWAGISPERLAIRIMLVMESLAVVQSEVRAVRTRQQGDGSRLRRLGDFSAAVFLQITRAAEQAPCRTVTLPPCPAPPRHQWLYPLLLGAGFSLLRFIANP